MHTRDSVLNYLSTHGSATGKAIAEHLKISPQAVNKHLKALVLNGAVVKRGSTKGASYLIATRQDRSNKAKKHLRTYALAGLEEHVVFQDIARMLNLKKESSPRTFEIIRYTFTEMLNNAVDHAFSLTGLITVTIDPYTIRFSIRDYGVGLFHSIHSTWGLPDEYAALGEVIKGKTTTMADKHSGEGIFFTSKAGDRVVYRSHAITLTFDNLVPDIVAEKSRFIKGTEVSFRINRRSKRDLKAIFAEYSPEEYDYAFEKTRVAVKLFQREYLSRSEARRLLAGLDRFREITLDFKGVNAIGQGFADEIFRVFRNAHPDIQIHTVNMDPVVDQMVRHVLRDLKSA